METFKNARISFKADGEEFRFNGGPNIGPLPSSRVYTKGDNNAVVPFEFSHKERLYVDLMRNGVMVVTPESEFIPVPEGCVLRFIVKVGEQKATVVHVGEKTPILVRKDLCGYSDEPFDRFAGDNSFAEGGFKD